MIQEGRFGGKEESGILHSEVMRVTEKKYDTTEAEYERKSLRVMEFKK